MTSCFIENLASCCHATRIRELCELFSLSAHEKASDEIVTQTSKCRRSLGVQRRGNPFFKIGWPFPRFG